MKCVCECERRGKRRRVAAGGTLTDLWVVGVVVGWWRGGAKKGFFSFFCMHDYK